MSFSIVRRRIVLGMVAVALATGLNVKSYAAGDLLEQVKQRGTLIVGLEGTYPPFSFQGEDGKLTGFEVDFANALAEHMGSKLKSRQPNGMGCWPRWSLNVLMWPLTRSLSQMNVRKI